jgi:hypothetical protein
MTPKSDWPRDPIAVSAETDPASPAETLHCYVNRWVALQRNEVLTDQDGFSDVVAWLRSHDIRADAVFRVPDDPERMLAGLASERMVLTRPVRSAQQVKPEGTAGRISTKDRAL